MSDGFDIDLKLLPPKLQMGLWVLGLDANTSRVNIAYRDDSFSTGLAYNYGGNAEASFGLRRFATTVGVSPSSGQVNVDLGYVFRGFRFGAATRAQQGAVGASVGFGARLLPFPAEMSTVFNNAGTGLVSLAGKIQRFPDNPLAWYGLNSNDVSAVSQAVNLGQRIHATGKRDRFGAGLRLDYSRQTGLTIFGGAQLRF